MAGHSATDLCCADSTFEGYVNVGIPPDNVSSWASAVPTFFQGAHMPTESTAPWRARQKTSASYATARASRSMVSTPAQRSRWRSSMQRRQPTTKTLPCKRSSKPTQSSLGMSTSLRKSSTYAPVIDQSSAYPRLHWRTHHHAGICQENTPAQASGLPRQAPPSQLTSVTPSSPCNTSYEEKRDGLHASNKASWAWRLTIPASPRTRQQNMQCFAFHPKKSDVRPQCPSVRCCHR